MSLRPLVLASLLCAPLEAVAATAEAPDEVVAPAPLAIVETPFPPGAEARTTAVVLLLTLDAEGTVTEAGIVESAGIVFDETARSALLASRFTPARRGETPIACRIHFTYVFEPPPPPVVVGTPAAAAPAMEGREMLGSDVTLGAVVRDSSAAERLRRSAQAVRVIETEQAARETADLGEVLARSEGVGVQRGGGLGSGTRFSMNGLTGDQVRFLLDGLPLDLAGFPFGLANVPVNLVKRVELYRGVVPIRFGADALGGAVNLATEQSVRGTHGAVSYQSGSFGTHRVTLGGRHLDPDTGLFLRASGYLDHADNDYLVDVHVPDSRGKLSAARVPRFHDAYGAWGGSLEAGVVERPWAKRLILRGFVGASDKELQHDVVMSVPYGEVRSGRFTTGTILRYDQDVGDVTIDLAGGWVFGETTFVDVGTCIYDWYGACLGQRAQPGEVTSQARDQALRQHGALARLNVGWQLHPRHALRLALAPTLVTRTGEERAPKPPDARDPMSAVHDLLTVVGGLEHETDLFDDRLENLLFVKDYLQVARSREALPAGGEIAHDRRSHSLGLGDALRLTLLDGLQAKASYEWALRLPRPDEAFGDGVFVAANPALEPETSHNLNFGVSFDRTVAPIGAVRAEVNGFLREAGNLIVLLGEGTAFAYQNVHGARSAGVEASAGWTSPGELLAVDANGTWQDLRNTSGDGAFESFDGDRIPNRPWLFANASARLLFHDLFHAGDELSIAWTLRYVHAFFRGWESVGRRDTKQVVPSQLVQSLGLTWLVRGAVPFSVTAEVQNLADEKTFDFFGAQRPGRALYVKTTASF